MNLLLVNDDGWGSEGIKALNVAASQFGEVTIIAPEHPQSGISHQLTFHRPLKLTEQAANSFSVDGTPADCVRIGLTQLGKSFDWVLAGINDGANMGVDIFVSGTVAAAREAAIFGTNAIALSQYRRRMGQPFDWTQSITSVESVLNKLLMEKYDSRPLINVNLPDANDNYAKVTHCPLDLSPLPNDYRLDGETLHYQGTYADRQRVEGHDIDVCFSGGIAVTFLKLNG